MVFFWGDLIRWFIPLKRSKHILYIVIELYNLFISHTMARLVGETITFNRPPPTNIKNMFGNWLNGVPKTDKQKIRIGVSAICWSIWTSRNDIIFNRNAGTNFLQVIRRVVHWIQQWVFLLPLELREDMVTECNRMLVVAQDCFFQATGWRHLNRIANG